MALITDCRQAPRSLTLEPYAEQIKVWPPSGRHILAQASEGTVVVYQAYPPSIGASAAQLGRFQGVPGFSMQRMTWIKTNFLWMMYRCVTGRCR